MIEAIIIMVLFVLSHFFTHLFGIDPKQNKPYDEVLGAAQLIKRVKA